MTRVPCFGRALLLESRDISAGTAFARPLAMIVRAPRVLVVLAFASLTPSLSCGNTKSAANPDGGSNDAGACKGEPISCAQGGPSGTGVACGGFEISGACVGGVWTCPKGMVDGRDCTCGEPGLSCSPQVCSANGPVCLDAGVGGDADAGHDAPYPPIDGPPEAHAFDGGLSPNGASCSSKETCQSGSCSQGVCCDTTCAFCHSCNLPGSIGTCIVAPLGTDPLNDCEPGDPAMCIRSGQCDGKGSCGPYPPGTSCGVDGAACDDAGRCR
jgi:hypothetical protein